MATIYEAQSKSAKEKRLNHQLRLFVCYSGPLLSLIFFSGIEERERVPV